MQNSNCFSCNEILMKFIFFSMENSNFGKDFENIFILQSKLQISIIMIPSSATLHSILSKKLSYITSFYFFFAICFCFSPNFLAWKFCGKTEFPRRRFVRNSAETVFPQSFHTRKIGDIKVIYAVLEKNSTD